MFAALRACEQLRTDIFYNRLNVKVVGTHAGMSTGQGGSTHFSLEDMGVVRAMPQSQLYTPADGPAAGRLIELLHESAEPAYLRLDRNPLPGIYHSDTGALALGGMTVLRDGPDCALLACGPLVWEALQAAETLQREHGLSCTVVDVYSIKPLPTGIIAQICDGVPVVFTIEEHNTTGGLGSAVAGVIAGGHPALLHRIGLEETYPKGGPVAHARQKNGLCARAIAGQVLAAKEIKR